MREISVTYRGKTYLLQVDSRKRILWASVYVKAHDKRATLRRVVNKVTLQNLQDTIQPRACHSCGRPFEERT